MMKATGRLTPPTYDSRHGAASALARRIQRGARAIIGAAASLVAIDDVAIASAQRVALEVRPRVGDTLRVSLELAMTLTGPRGAADSGAVLSTTYQVRMRDVVERSDAKGTTILAIIDSVGVATSGTQGLAPFPGVNPGMQRTRLRLMVMPDGSSRVIEGLQQLEVGLQGVLGEMPAVLPPGPIAPGESWVKELALPAIGSAASTSATGRLLATFRLDSLTQGGERAWISVQGRVEPAANTTPGTGQLSGTLSGTMQLDRRRAWVADWRAVVNIESAFSVSAGAPPQVVRVRLQHTMRTAPPRR